MSQEEYTLLKTEMPSIAEQIKLFPEELQEKVFQILISTLMDRSISFGELTTASDTTANVEPSSISSPEKRNYVEEFKSFVDEKDPNSKLNAMEFATLVAYFFTYLAPDENKNPEITEKIVTDAYKLSSHKPPGDIKSTLNNAKNKHAYLDKTSTPGVYKITPSGEYFIKSELPRKTK